MGAAKSVAECSRGDVVNVLGFGNANKSTERELILLGWDARLLRSYTQFLIECQPRTIVTLLRPVWLFHPDRNEKNHSSLFSLLFFLQVFLFSKMMKLINIHPNAIVELWVKVCHDNKAFPPGKPRKPSRRVPPASLSKPQPKGHMSIVTKCASFSLTKHYLHLCPIPLFPPPPQSA